jgi:uncharacterized protein (TIGR00290 family)
MDDDPTPILLSWSGGKDCMMALMALRADPHWEVAGLLTSVNERFGRVAMHGTREPLLRLQAAALGLSVRVVYLPDASTNAQYEARMAEATASAQAEGIRHVAFGDLFLEDIRAYRERQMEAAGMTAVFPLWKQDTRRLSDGLVEEGWRIILTCVDGEQLDGDRVGRDYDRSFLDGLPEGVDPCGENGEFHTFVWDGPAFARPLEVRRGERVVRNGRFHFIDLV